MLENGFQIGNDSPPHLSPICISIVEKHKSISELGLLNTLQLELVLLGGLIVGAAEDPRDPEGRPGRLPEGINNSFAHDFLCTEFPIPSCRKVFLEKF